MSISTEIISGLMVEQADTPVLGTGLARGESSNLSKPTKNYESYGRFQKRIKNKFKSLC